MPTLARLDKNQVLVGFTEAGPKTWKTRGYQVAVPDGCDLEPGRYRWDGATFVALPPAGGQDALEEPDAVRAIALGFAKISETVELPQETLDWLDHYDTSIEGRMPGGKRRPT
jgi:hypothetical protein